MSPILRTILVLDIASSEKKTADTSTKDRHTNRTFGARPFIAVDGEGGGTNELGQQNYLLMRAQGTNDYAARLFASNVPLLMIERLEFILALPQNAILVGFFFDYDVTQILRDLPVNRLARLLSEYGRGGRRSPYTMVSLEGQHLTRQSIDIVRVVKKRNTSIRFTVPWNSQTVELEGNHYYIGKLPKAYTTWIREVKDHTADNNARAIELGDYRHYGIEYVPKQYLRIIRQVKVGGKIYSIMGTARTINEVGGFFQKSFVKVIKDWKVADDDTIRMIERNKAERSAFTEITPEIDRYCREECRLLAATMERLRARLIEGTRQVKRQFPKQFPDISLVPEAWRGAGFVAAKLLNSTGTPKAKHLPALPRKLENMVIEAYFGGRFEISRTGYIPGPIYEYDICSAYPAGMPLLPCPLHTKWRRVSEPSPGTLYIADLAFEHPAHNKWCGFPFRTKAGHLYWPMNGSGVYWSVEIEAAQKLLHANVTFRRIWQAEKRCDCTPYSWVEPLYEFRKSLGKGIEGFPTKLGLNALYGKQAQCKGARTYHNLVHAGLITAITRAKLISAIALDPEAVLMLATDGVYSTKPLRGLEIGDALGAWEHGREQIHPDMFIVQPGLYWFPKEKSSDRSHKTRGIPKSIAQQNAPAFVTAWEEYRLDCIKPMQRTFFTSFPPVPAQFNVPVPINTFIGLRLALHRNKPSLAGCWLNIEKKMSFDWSLKRARGELNGTFIEHWPIKGDVNSRSTCYDEKLLTELTERNLELEAMPDFVQIVDHE